MSAASRDAAFAEFVAARQTHLRRAAYAICGDWHRAEDLLQTAFVKLYVAWPRLREPAAAEAYTRRILVRSNIDEARRPWRRESPGLDGHDAQAEAGPAYEERSALVDALQLLPAMQRKVLVLRHMLDLSVAETADALGISEGTVKSHTSRGLTALEEALARTAGD
ncbi:MAG: SigE family RNA polymerase sigma factor [Nocardioides sp.]